MLEKFGLTSDNISFHERITRLSIFLLTIVIMLIPMVAHAILPGIIDRPNFAVAYYILSPLLWLPLFVKKSEKKVSIAVYTTMLSILSLFDVNGVISLISLILLLLIYFMYFQLFQRLLLLQKIAETHKIHPANDEKIGKTVWNFLFTIFKKALIPTIAGSIVAICLAKLAGAE